MLKEKLEQRKCFPTAWGKLIPEEEAYRQLNRQIAAMTANLFQVMRIFEPSWEKRTEAICDIANMMNMAVAGTPEEQKDYVNASLYEAARVDGASRWQRIRYITIPLLMPTFFVLLIMSIGNFLNSGIDQFLAFGNALNKDWIEVLDLYVYNLGIGSGQISFSVAVGIMKSFVALVLFASANFASKKIRGTSVF